MLASEIVRDIEQALAVEEPARGLHLVGDRQVLLHVGEHALVFG